MKRLDYLCDGIGLTFTLAQTEELFRLISIIIVCISSVCSLAFSLYNWYKKAKSDKQITKEELKEGAKIIVDGANKITETIKKGKEEHKNDQV